MTRIFILKILAEALPFTRIRAGIVLLIVRNSKNKKAKMRTFDSLQSTTTKQIKKGATYLGAMEKNLSVLKEVLK